jgi:hypothetical protein
MSRVMSIDWPSPRRRIAFPLRTDLDRSPRLRRPSSALRHLRERASGECAEPVTVVAPSVGRRTTAGVSLSRMSGGYQGLLPDVLEMDGAGSADVV